MKGRKILQIIIILKLMDRYNICLIINSRMPLKLLIMGINVPIILNIVPLLPLVDLELQMGMTTTIPIINLN